MRYISIYVFLLLLLLSCERGVSPQSSDGELVEVRLLPPQVYGSVPAVLSKATTDRDEILKDLPVRNLEEGSTLWLSYELRKDDGTYEPPVLKAYSVRKAGGGYMALYACGHSKDGNYLYVSEEDAQKTTSPLYLKHDSYYRFRMISPAMKIFSENLHMTVDNGDSFASSDQRYESTSSTDVHIESQSSGVYYVNLKPMIQQTARLKFTLKKGNNVSSVRMMADGVEISGLQNPYMHQSGSLQYNWSSLELKDTLVMRLGDKDARVTLPGDMFSLDKDGNLVGYISILPTDARSNTVTILMNMSVNGVPTQYITTLNRMLFEHARSYNMFFEVGLKDDIVVVNWQNISWTEDI